MTTTRFHKAAKDGLVDILKEATKKDSNQKDEDGMTPTLWAAYEGNLDALRVIVGRGGDPGKANYHFGQNALHIAASRGHMSCVSFLVAFNVNLWALDHDYHTAMDLAAMNGRLEILNYLDKTAAKLEMSNKRKCELLKDRAQKDAERRLKKFEERSKRERDKQKKLSKKLEKECESTENCDLNATPDYLRKLSENNGQSFTQIVSNGVGSIKKSSSTVGIKKIIDRRFKSSTQGKQAASGYHINEIKDDTNTKTVRSLLEQHQYRKNILSDYCTTGKRGRIKDLFDIKQRLHRSTSQPDLIHESLKHRTDLGRDNVLDNVLYHGESGSLFDRPGFGSVSFRQTAPVTLSNLPSVTTLCHGISKNEHEEEACSIGSAGSLTKRILPSHTISWDTNSNSTNTSDEENSTVTSSEFQLPPSLHRFLLAVGVTEYEEEFRKQRIDMQALFMLSDGDLSALGVPLGPRRKLLNAIKLYKQQSSRCKEIFENL